MKLYLTGHDYKYAVEQMLLTLYPEERPEYPPARERGDGAEISLHRSKTYATAVCRLLYRGTYSTGRAAVREDALTDAVTAGRLLSHIVKLAFYRAALHGGMPRPVWGALTGVRPGKLMAGYLAAGMDDRSAVRAFESEYDVSPRRAELCLRTSHATLAAKAALAPQDVCLYVGIPFCPTRCAYCSFVSQSVEKSMALIAPFLEALLREIRATAQAVRGAGLRVVSLYVGGGTPTTLSAEQLDTLFSALEAEFDLSSVRERTVEAGRPDTITADKLEILRLHGVDRISVNPQTMEDSVLEAIGRRHTAQDVRDALALARSAGAAAVNMDLIAGLPSDTAAGFRRTLDEVLALAPENITVHTLARKKGSYLTEHGGALPDAAAVGEMLDYAEAALTAAGYAPYYLYRQKFMSGAFENVGWAQPGTENLYNICIMEELCSIIAMGGGASTKLVGDGRIQRAFDPKYPREYIDGMDHICETKSAIKEFYES